MMRIITTSNFDNETSPSKDLKDKEISIEDKLKKPRTNYLGR